METKVKNSYIFGIDEVGRGPIAGPVCVCSFALEKELYKDFVSKSQEHLNLEIRDSKKLTKIQRHKWFDFLSEQKKNGKCFFNFSFVSSSNIDKFGISKCIQRALDESLDKTILDIKNKNEGKDFNFRILLDGGLKARDIFDDQETFVKGDEVHPVISFASVVAKVSRDKVMANFSKEYAHYGFEKNSGYGTSSHYSVIKDHGLSKIHRKTFIHLGL